MVLQRPLEPTGKTGSVIWQLSDSNRAPPVSLSRVDYTLNNSAQDGLLVDLYEVHEGLVMAEDGHFIALVQVEHELRGRIRAGIVLILQRAPTELGRLGCPDAGVPNVKVSTDSISSVITHRAIEPHRLDLVPLVLRYVKTKCAIDASDLMGLAVLVHQAARARGDHDTVLGGNICTVPCGSYSGGRLEQLDFCAALPREWDPGAGDLEGPQAPDGRLGAELDVCDCVGGEFEGDDCNAVVFELAYVARVDAAADTREDVGHGGGVGERRDRHGPVVLLLFLHLLLQQPTRKSGCFLGVLIWGRSRMILILEGEGTDDGCRLIGEISDAVRGNCKAIAVPGHESRQVCRAWWCSSPGAQVDGIKFCATHCVDEEGIRAVKGYWRSKFR